MNCLDCGMEQVSSQSGSSLGQGNPALEHRQAAGQRRAKFIVCLGELAPPGVENSPMHRHQKRIKAETRGGLVFVKNPLHILGVPEITNPAEKVGPCSSAALRRRAVPQPIAFAA